MKGPSSGGGVDDGVDTDTLDDSVSGGRREVDAEDRNDEMVALQEICDPGTFYYFRIGGRGAGAAIDDVHRIRNELSQLFWLNVVSEAPPDPAGAAAAVASLEAVPSQMASSMPVQFGDGWSPVKMYQEPGSLLGPVLADGKDHRDRHVAAGGRLLVAPRVDPPGISVVVSRDLSPGTEIRHLPPIGLDFVLQENYPSTSKPDFRVFCPWLSTSQVFILVHLISRSYSCQARLTRSDSSR